MWYLYILECGNKSLYTGITTDVERRLKEHSSGRGCAFTRSFKVKKLVYTEKLGSRSKALKREFQVKTLSRSEKLRLMRKKQKPLNKK